MEEDPQESTQKLIENAEVIVNAEKIDSGNIGIIGGKKKKKPVEDQFNDEVSSNQDNEHSSSVLPKENKEKQYYDPFSKLAGPPRNENIWHYSLFPSAGNKKSNPPGLSLFTTNRENKYSMFSSNFYNQNQEEEENDEENEKQQTSFEEKSDSEFSEKSFLQNKLKTSQNPSEQFERNEGMNSNLTKNEPDFSSRYYRTFNFPQSNNPFSLSQLLNPKPAEEEETFNSKAGIEEKETNTPWNAFPENYDSHGLIGQPNKAANALFFGNEDIGQNTNSSIPTFRPNVAAVNTDNLSRKPPPGFKPNK